MDQAQAKALLPLIQAFADGRTIEVCRQGIWYEVLEGGFTTPPDACRIKPKVPEYRLFQYRDKDTQYNGLVTVATRNVGNGDASTHALTSYESRILRKEGRWLTDWLPLKLKD